MLSVRLAIVLTVVSVVSAHASAQKPPPPKVATAFQPRPSLINNRLDMSYCKYPVRALRQRIEGCCRMKVEVNVEGKASRMSGECTHDLFLEPSEACLLPQAFRPALMNGKAAEGVGDVVVEYRLQGSETPPIIVFLERVFPNLKKPPRQREQPEICKRRPDDLIAGLPPPAG